MMRRRLVLVLRPGAAALLGAGCAQLVRSGWTACRSMAARARL